MTQALWHHQRMDKLLPDTQRLVSLRKRGMTYKQIAQWLLDNEGVEVSPTSIGSALSRAGVSNGRARYAEHLPWTVHAEHIQHYAARMLRLLGRRDSGLQISEADNARLDSWLERLRDEHAIVAYAPEQYPDDGFVYVDGDFPKDGIPILRPAKFSQRRRGS